ADCNYLVTPAFNQPLQNSSAFWMVFDKENSHFCRPKTNYQVVPKHARLRLPRSRITATNCGFYRKSESDFFLEDRHRERIAFAHLALHSASARYSESLAQLQEIHVYSSSFPSLPLWLAHKSARE